MAISDLPFIMVRCLILTILIELCGALILGVRGKQNIINVILVNVITNPIVVLVPVILNVYVSLKARNISLYSLEIITVFVEGVVYLKTLDYKKLNLFLLSLILNLLSYGAGLILNSFI